MRIVLLANWDPLTMGGSIGTCLLCLFHNLAPIAFGFCLTAIPTYCIFGLTPPPKKGSSIFAVFS